MTSPVVLHIGPHKTGSTSIQHWLRDHEDLLAEYGVRFPRGWLRLNNHFELPLTLMRSDRMSSARLRGDEWRDPAWCADVIKQVADDLDAHPKERTVLSCEGLGLLRYGDELGALRALVGDAIVVMYLRDRFAYRASLEAMYCQPGMPGLSDDPEAYNYTAPDSWLFDFSALVERWQHHFTRVAVVSYDRSVEWDGSVVPSFLRGLGVPVVDVEGYRLNRRGEPIVRVEGNRLTNGLRFGEVAAADRRLSGVRRS